MMDAEPAMPTTVKVGPYRVRVHCGGSEIQRHLQLTDADGDFDFSRLLIRVDQELPRDQRARVLLHEVLHAVWRAAINMEETKTTEERAVTILAGGLLGVLRENPALVAFLLDERSES